MFQLSGIFRLGVTLGSAAALSACLSACLFGGDNATFAYTTELHDHVTTVRERHDDGSVRRSLGVGVEIRADEYGPFVEEGVLTLWPITAGSFSKDTSDSGLVHELVRTPDFVRITRDSTLVSRFETPVLLPHLVTVRGFAGSPCRFSRPRAFLATFGSPDTIAVKATGYHLDRSADGVRLAVLIDTAASRRADARVDFTRPVTVLLDVTCPKP